MSLTGAGLNSMRSIPTFGTVGALSEIIDNSIQWRINGIVANINVILIERGQSKQVKDIIITDNGVGMDDIIDTCLFFGGGSNHGVNTTLGKFGIGLPYACCSQSKNYHIYSWQQKGHYKYVYRRHDDFNANDLVVDRAHVVLRELPKLFLQTNPDLAIQDSGTIIYWEDCDRVDPKMSKTIIKHLNEQLGRTYRNFIKKDDLNIIWKTFYIPSVNSTPTKNHEDSTIKINDPLRLISSGTLLIDSPYNLDNGKQDIFEKFGDVITIKSKPDPNLNGHEHEMQIICSIAKEAVQKPNGLDGGNTPIGKLCNRSYGISLVRLGREIKLDSFGYIMPNSADPRLRWMKIEASFLPVSDNLLNVNANKTDAINFRHMSVSQYDDYLVEGDGVIDFDIDFRYKIACVIQKLLTDSFKVIEERGKGGRTGPTPFKKCPNCQNFSLKNGNCDNCGPLDICADHLVPYVNGVCPICEKIVTPSICMIHKVQLDDQGNCPKCTTPTDPLTEEEKAELMQILRRYELFNENDVTIRATIDWFVKSSKSHFILFVPDVLNNDSFVTYTSYKNKFELIFINTLHPFYMVHIHDHYIKGDDELESMILFIISWVHAENHYQPDPDSKKLIERFRTFFSLKLSENLTQWNNLIPQNRN